MSGGWGGYHQSFSCGTRSGFPVLALALNRVFLIQSCWKCGRCSFQWTGSSAGGWNTGSGLHMAGGVGAGASEAKVAGAYKEKTYN